VDVLFAWLLADFISGIIHWSEDRYLNTPSRFKFLDGIRTDNDLHHLKPYAMLKFKVFQNINTSVVIAWPLALILYFIGAPTFIWLALCFVSFGNLVHRWAHTIPDRQDPLVRLLQRIGLLCSFEQHALHHFSTTGVVKKEESSMRFCVMTCWLNVLLDKINFFKALEKIICWLGFAKIC
jgi:plasmanylethanolamine desaturase